METIGIPEDFNSFIKINNIQITSVMLYETTQVRGQRQMKTA